MGGGKQGRAARQTAVAAGGRAEVGGRFPPARWLMLLLAGGCGLSRLLSGAHFASDVVVGACLGVIVAWALGRVIGARPSRGAF